MDTDPATIDVETPAGVFRASAAGEPTHGWVILLHGFPQTRYAWRSQLPALAEAGFRAVAPDQRGYAPGVRPREIDAYTGSHLVDDALAIADAIGAARFHLVGHDWGGQIAWWLAARHPERVRSLCVLSRPHPAAFARALRSDAAQSKRSRHHRAFQDPATADRLLEDGARRLRRSLADQGVAARDVDAYLAVLGERDALDAALNWYRAATQLGPEWVGTGVASIRRPTTFVWGDADATVGRDAAEATRECVDAPYRFVVVPGAGHFLTDQTPQVVNDALLERLRGPE